MEREDFINNVLNSVDEIAKVSPDDIVLKRIEQQINETTISKRTLWLAAASIVVLISFNVILLTGKFNTNQSEMASLELSINKNNQLYK